MTRIDFIIDYESTEDTHDIHCCLCNRPETISLSEALELIGLEIDEDLTNISEICEFNCPHCHTSYNIQININIEN